MGWAEKSGRQNGKVKVKQVPPNIQVLSESVRNLMVRIGETEKALRPQVGLQIRRPNYGTVVIENQTHIMWSLVYLINEFVGSRGYPHPLSWQKTEKKVEKHVDNRKGPSPIIQ